MKRQEIYDMFDMEDVPEEQEKLADVLDHFEHLFNFIVEKLDEDVSLDDVSDRIIEVRDLATKAGDSLW